jgi:hypothetical protein
MSWHADARVLERYAEGVLDDANAYSIEAHLLACDVCRARTPRDVERMDSIWIGVRASMHAPKIGPVEWVLRRLGVSDHIARLLAATPSLTLSWLLAVALTLAFALAASHAGRGTPLPFLLVAPLLPLAGVATAYGPGVDPTYEMGAAAPVQGLRVLLIRAMAVFVATAALAGAGSFELPHIDLVSAAWLLPSIGLTMACLAVSTWLPPVRSALIVGAVWVVVAIAGSATAVRPITVHSIEWFTPVGQVGLAGAAVLAAVVLATRGQRIGRVSG